MGSVWSAGHLASRFRNADEIIRDARNERPGYPWPDRDALDAMREHYTELLGAYHALAELVRSRLRPIQAEEEEMIAACPESMPF